MDGRILSPQGVKHALIIGLSSFILWLSGILGADTSGGIIHVLLAVAIIVVPIPNFSG